jgi:hypothetical protein
MIGVYLLCASLFVQANSKPLPELRQFLKDFRKTLHTNDLLLSQYTYTEKRTHIELGSDDQPKKAQTLIYHVTRAADGSIYRQLVSNDGSPVRSAKPEKVERGTRKDEDKVIDDVFAGYDMRIIGREEIEGRLAIRISFQPRADYRPSTREGKIIHHVEGEAWVNEADHQLVRVDAHVIDTISLGFGLLAKLQKGATLHAERRKVNDEVWLPVKTEVSLSARVLLLKGIHVREVLEYSDYKKFNVETIIKVE